MSSARNPGNVIGGHKANIANPNTSDESKEHSRRVIRDLENGLSTANGVNESGKEVNRVIGGFKATLHNPNSGDEAKQRAKAKLEELGVEVKE